MGRIVSIHDMTTAALEGSGSWSLPNFPIVPMSPNEKMKPMPTIFALVVVSPEGILALLQNQ